METPKKAKKLTNRELADALKRAAMSYLLKKGYSCFEELGLVSWGKRRADVIALNLKAHVVLCEIKSSPQDFLNDHKWHEYLPFSNKMYFVMLPKTFENKRVQERMFDLRRRGVGVLTLNPVTGYLDSRIPAKQRKMQGRDKKAIVVRMAWRNGDVSKRTSHRTRQFIQ